MTWVVTTTQKALCGIRGWKCSLENTALWASLGEKGTVTLSEARPYIRGFIILQISMMHKAALQLCTDF